MGVATRGDLWRLAGSDGNGHRALANAVRARAVVAYPDENLRVVVHRMADTGLTRLPVVDRDDPRKLLGLVALTDLLKARALNLEAERRRERVIGLPRVGPARLRRPVSRPPAPQ